MSMKLRIERFAESRAGDAAPGNRIIGLEMRLIGPYGEREEVAIWPLDVALPDGTSTLRWSAEVTIHTSAGDATSVPWPLPL